MHTLTDSAVHLSRTHRIALICVLVTQVLLAAAHHLFHLFAELPFAIIGAALVSAAVLISPLESSLPTYAHLHKMRRELGSAFTLRAIYAWAACLYCLTGSLYEEFFPELFKGVARMVHPLLDRSVTVPTAELVRGFISSTFTAQLMQVFAAAAALSVGIATTSALSQRFGPRSRLLSAYGQHRLKFLIHRDESNLAWLHFASGLTLAFGLNALFTAFLLLREGPISPEDWAHDLADDEPRSDVLFRRMGAHAFRDAAAAAAFVLPFWDPHSMPQSMFLGMLLAPLLFWIAADLQYPTKFRRQPHTRILIITAGLFPVLAGLYQCVVTQANPLIVFIEREFAVAGPDLLAVISLAGRLLFAATLAYSGFDFVFIKPTLDFRSHDPIALYRMGKLQVVALSWAVRVSFAGILLPSVQADPNHLPAFLQATLGYVFALMMGVFIQPSRAEPPVREIAARFSLADLRLSVTRHEATLNRELYVRDVSNVIWMVGLSVFVVFEGHVVLRISALLAPFICLIHYYGELVRETALAKKHFGLNRDLKVIASGVESAVKKMGKRNTETPWGI